MIGPSSMRTLRAGCASTILPASLPRYFSKSASFAICTRTTSAVIGTVRARRPFLREADQRLNLRLDEMRAEPNQRPAFAEAPALLVDVRESPLAERLHRPLTRLLDAGRSGEPRPIDVAEPRDVIHHLRAIEPLVADPAEHRVIELSRFARRQTPPRSPPAPPPESRVS